MFGFLKMKWSFFRSKKLLEDYDTVFFSNEASSGIWSVKPGTKTYYYAHSISRHLFDQKGDYLAKVSWYKKPIFLIFANILKYIYIRELQKMDVIFVNSLNNKNRIQEWIGRDDAIILYPPVDTVSFSRKDESEIMQVFAKEGIHVGYKNYYLSFARLTHAKRIDRIIEAFKLTPSRRVVILYGENDSQKAEFMELGACFDNIIFHKLSKNEHLPWIISGSIATIALSKNEDFGMVATESMACGIPVIAVDEGGYRETVVHHQTGLLINANFSNNDIRDAILALDREKSASMETSCHEQAEKFSLSQFRSLLLSYFS